MWGSASLQYAEATLQMQLPCERTIQQLNTYRGLSVAGQGTGVVAMGNAAGPTPPTGNRGAARREPYQPMGG